MPIRQYIVRCYKCKNEHLRPTRRAFICNKCRVPVKNYPRTFYHNRKLVFERDHNRCQSCGDKRKLVCHHIDCNKKHNFLSNLITLCNQCHTSLHKTYTKKVLRSSIIYNLFPDRFRWGKQGKRAVYGVSPEPPKSNVIKKVPKRFYQRKLKSIDKVV